MTEKIEGTILLEGLIEGRLPAQPGADERLRQWIAFAADAGARLKLEIDGGAFSVLGDGEARPVGPLAPDPAEKISALVGEMLKIFPPGERPRISSTLRSTEFRKGREIQTVYAVGPDGAVATRDRTLATDTAAPPVPLSTPQRVRSVLLGLVVALLIFAVSGMFIDYRKVVHNIVGQVVAPDARTFPVDASVFGDYFTIAKKTMGSGRTLIVTLQRTAVFPRSDQDSPAAPATMPAQRLAADAIAHGYIRAEYYDETNQFLGASFQRIRDLRDHDTVDLSFSLDQDTPPRRIVLTY